MSKVLDKLVFKSDLSESDITRGAKNIAEVLDLVFGTVWRVNPSIADTPTRFMKYLAEFRQPIDLDKIFGSTFKVKDGHSSMVVQAPIPFRMMCEHHLLPAVGVAGLGYIPHDKVLGLSKFTRLVQAVGVERPSLQEHIQDRILDLMETHLAPKGIMLIIKAEHGCMACRGVNSPGVITTSSAVRGLFRDVAAARAEMLTLIQHELSRR